MQSTTLENKTDNSQQSPSGKTFPAYSQVKITPSARFLDCFAAKTVNYNHQGRNGKTLVMCMAQAAKSLGASWTLNISECHNAAAVSSLYAVLEKTSIPHQYYLSKKACDGILRRAENRGKVLPELLKKALEQANEFMGDGETAGYYDQQSISEYGEEQKNSSTLMARDYKSPTDLVCGYTSTQFAQYQEGVGTLRAAGGDIGGGSETFVVRNQEAYSIQSAAIGRDGSNDEVRSLYMDNKTPTLTCADRHAVAYSLTVRRLMPIECERLQGFPDNWTAIPYKKKDAENCPDGPRYKAMGNSMAVPVMKWIGERVLSELQK